MWSLIFAFAKDDGGQGMHITPEMIVEVIKVLWGLSMTGFAFGGWIFWKLWKRVEDNLVDICKHHRECRDELPLRYVNRREFEQKWIEWKPGREDIWEALNGHYHDAAGGVVRRK
jgi:hypothetical protein